MTASALYHGTIRHRRFAVRDRDFTHGVALAYVDLDEAPSLAGGRLVRRRPGLVRLRARDHLSAAAVRDVVAEKTGAPAPDGAVRVLTHLRTLGHCFNPVSFYYCFDRDEQLRALVAHVTNTPWGDTQTYVLAGDGPVLHGDFPKAMHVSPFMGMDQRYAWHAAAPGSTLSVHIENLEDGTRVFDATLALERRPLTRRTLADLVLTYPLATVRVLALIYAHALVLGLRRVPIHPRPAEVPA
jgi:DUF1365 family protein